MANNTCRSIPISWIERYSQLTRDDGAIDRMLVIWEAEQAIAAKALADAIKNKTKTVPPVLVAKRPFADAIAKMRDKKPAATPVRKPTLEELL